MKYQYKVNPTFDVNGQSVNALEAWKQQSAGNLEDFLNAAGELGFEFFTATAIGDPDPDEWRTSKVREQVTVCIVFRRLDSVEVSLK